MKNNDEIMRENDRIIEELKPIAEALESKNTAAASVIWMLMATLSMGMEFEFAQKCCDFAEKIKQRIKAIDN